MQEAVENKIWNRFLFSKIYKNILYTWAIEISQLGDIGDLSLQLQFDGVMMLYKEYAEHHLILLATMYFSRKLYNLHILNLC